MCPKCKSYNAIMQSWDNDNKATCRCNDCGNSYEIRIDRELPKDYYDFFKKRETK